MEEIYNSMMGLSLGQNQLNKTNFKNILSLNVSPSPIEEILVTRRGKIILNGSQFQNILVFVLSNGQFVCEFKVPKKQNKNYCMVEMHREDTICTCNGICLEYLSGENFQMISRLFTDHSKEIFRAIETTHSEMITAGCDGLIKVYDDFGELKGTLRGHTQPITSLLEINNNIIVSTGYDCTLRFWDLNTLRPMEEYTIGGIQSYGNNCLYYASEQNKIFIGCCGGEIKVIDLNNKNIQTFSNGISLEIRSLIRLNNGFFLAALNAIQAQFALYDSNMNFNSIACSGNNSGTNSVAKLGNNLFISGDGIGNIMIWEY